MPAAELAPDIISFSAAIGSCEEGQQWEKSLALFHDIQSRRKVGKLGKPRWFFSTCPSGDTVHEEKLGCNYIPGNATLPNGTTDDFTLLSFRKILEEAVKSGVGTSSLNVW